MTASVPSNACNSKAQKPSAALGSCPELGRTLTSLGSRAVSDVNTSLLGRPLAVSAGFDRLPTSDLFNLQQKPCTCEMPTLNAEGLGCCQARMHDQALGLLKSWLLRTWIHSHALKPCMPHLIIFVEKPLPAAIELACNAVTAQLYHVTLAQW